MELSVVIPAHDEEATVGPLHDQIAVALAHEKSVSSYEIIFVNDGSKDATAQRLADIHDSAVRVVHLRKRSGKSAAIAAGLKAARNAFIALMDGDLQNDPSDLRPMIKAIIQGNDYVIGWRRQRQDSALRRLSSSVANGVRRRVLGDPFHDIGCGLHVFKRDCLAGVTFFEGVHRFLPYIAARRGYQVVELPIRDRRRPAGRSKYGLWNRVFRATADMFRVKRRWG